MLQEEAEILTTITTLVIEYTKHFHYESEITKGKNYQGENQNSTMLLDFSEAPIVEHLREEDRWVMKANILKT